MIAVIMAGGLGTRLRPLTYSIPKPLLPVGEKPILEIIIGKLKAQGIRDLFLMTGYHSELIQAYFQNGSRFGVRITYIKEKQPLGTAGSLALLKKRVDHRGPFLVMNGDILTKLNFLKMLDFHLSEKAALTVGTIKHKHQLPFGILELQERTVVSIKEKPSFSYPISTGIYILNPQTLSFIPKNSYFTMPELITFLIKVHHKVLSYLIPDYWLAIEQMDQFNEALTEKKKWK